MMTDDTKNYYEVLDVHTGASPREVYNAYIKAKQAYSSESIALYSLFGNDSCSKQLEVIEEAYHILSDPGKRRAYDSARHIAPNAHIAKANIGLSSSITIDTREIPDIDTTSPSNINKLIVKQKFVLHFEPDQAFEKEIESATEFSGAFLKKIRQYKKVEIHRLMEMTKVSKTYLEKIEEEDFSNMPAMAYVRGFIYQYAKCLKLNPDLVTNSYLARLKQKK